MKNAMFLKACALLCYTMIMEQQPFDPFDPSDATSSDADMHRPDAAISDNSQNEADPPTNASRFSRAALILALLLATAIALFFFLRGGWAPAASGGATPIPQTSVPQLDEAFHGLALYALDVGQGDCLFLRSPNGKTMLVDSGPDGSFGRIHLFLQRQGVERLDVVVCTHLHTDHIGSMTELMNHYEVGTLYLPPFDIESSEYAQMLEAMDTNGVFAQTVTASIEPLPEWDPDCTLYVLSPYDVPYDDENDTSIVLRVEYGYTAALLMGDATELAERLAIKALPNRLFSADVLKVGHHGSDTSTSAKLLSTVKPKFAIISVGRSNRYGLPSESIVARLEKAGARVLRTDLDGTVLIALDGERAWVVE